MKKETGSGRLVGKACVVVSGGIVWDCQKRSLQDFLPKVCDVRFFSYPPVIIQGPSDVMERSKGHALQSYSPVFGEPGPLGCDLPGCFSPPLPTQM